MSQLGFCLLEYPSFIYDQRLIEQWLVGSAVMNIARKDNGDGRDVTCIMHIARLRAVVVKLAISQIGWSGECSTAIAPS